MDNYYLPINLKGELRKIWGNPLFGNKKEVLKEFKNTCKKRGYKKIIAVGDYCSLVLPADVKIFDGKIKRKTVKNIPEFSFACSNPPGTIQKKVWPKIKKVIKNRKNLFIKGEEDLLVIPAVLLSEERTVVIYGFPGKGICLIEVTPQVKKDLKELLKRFKTNPV